MFSHAINQIREMKISMVIAYIQTGHELALELHIHIPVVFTRHKKRERQRKYVSVYIYKYIQSMLSGE